MAMDAALASDARGEAAAHRLEATAEVAGLGLGSYDLDSGEVTWNRAMWALIGRVPEPCVMSEQTWVSQVVHPDDRDRVRLVSRHWSAIGNQPFVNEYRVVWPDGTVRTLATRILRQGSTLHGLTFDVSELHQARGALAEAHERAALAARGAGIGTWEHRFADGSTLWDEQMCTLHGLDGRLHAGVQADPSRFALAEDVRHALVSMHAAVTRNEPLAYVMRIHRADGELRTLAVRATLVKDGRGDPERLIGLAWDVTEARRAAQALAAQEQAQAASDAKSRFLTQVSHELRTPLNAVLGFTQLLQADEPGGTPRALMLQQVQRSGEHLLALVNQLLDLSKVESGNVLMTIEPVELGAFVRETLPMIEPLAARRGISVECAFSAALTVRADRVALRQVLINLLSNAVKFNRAQGRVRVGLQAEAGHGALSVTDTGTGLSAQQCAGLFEPFNRLGAEGRGIEGSGIGLSLVKRLVERMGGGIDVASHVGSGSRFTVRLPRLDADGVAASRPAPVVTPAAPRPAARGRVLYIEDNAVNAQILAAMVAHRPGVELVCAADGRSGIARALALQPDLVLIDMCLPDLHGLEVLQALRAVPAASHMQCVALSANAMPGDIEQARRAGFDGYWTKPIELQRFLDGLDRLLAPG